jgi:hypothetical protein
MRLNVLSSVLLFTLFFGFANVCVHSQEDAVIVQGNPPLTQSMVVKTLVLLEWSLDIRLADEQKAKIASAIIGYWKANNRTEMSTTLEAVKLVDGLSKASQAEQDKAKEIIHAEMLKGLRSDTNDEISQMVLHVYETSRSGSLSTAPQMSDRSTAMKGNQVGADGFTGIYVGTRNFSSSMSTVQLDYVTFLPGGHVYWTLPAEGLRYFDPRVAQRVHPDEWGTYEVVGREIRVLVGNNLRYVFVKEEDHLKLQPHSGSSSVRTYSRLATADGLKLQGSYRRSETEPAITFSRDGKFRDDGIFRNFGTISRADGTIYQDDGRGGAGTYFIGQNTLELRYADGRVKRFTFTGLPGDLTQEPVRSFRINYETFHLR